MTQPDVVAEFELQGAQYCDTNPLARTNRVYGVSIPGVRPGNYDRWTMHAEFAAMLQAYDAGLRGGHGKLTVRGAMVCPWCKGDIKTMARHLRLESLTVLDDDGSVIEFKEPSQFLPIKQGGKAWR
jgi:hypothetical protein